MELKADCFDKSKHGESTGNTIPSLSVFAQILSRMYYNGLKEWVCLSVFVFWTSMKAEIGPSLHVIQISGNFNHILLLVDLIFVGL